MTNLIHLTDQQTLILIGIAESASGTWRCGGAYNGIIFGTPVVVERRCARLAKLGLLYLDEDIWMGAKCNAYRPTKAGIEWAMQMGAREPKLMRGGPSHWRRYVDIIEIETRELTREEITDMPRWCAENGVIVYRDALRGDIRDIFQYGYSIALRRANGYLDLDGRIALSVSAETAVPVKLWWG